MRRTWVLLTVIALAMPLGCALHRDLSDTAVKGRFAPYAGTYQMGTDVEMIVRPDGDRLMAKVSGQDYFQVFPQFRDSFHFKVVDAELTFTRSQTGAISGLTLVQNGRTFSFDRTTSNLPSDDSRMIDAGGYRVRMVIKGAGKPTVVFEAGLGESLDAWEKELPLVSAFTSAVAYDRSGLGLSERSRTARTARHVAEDLHRSLHNAGLTPPFVLVGNSAGGLYLRVFAHLYPDEVAAMVLVEPSSEDYEGWLRKAHPEAFETSKLEMERATPGFRDHLATWAISLKQATTAWPLPSVPMVLITGMRHEPDEEEKRQMWLVFHHRFVERVPGARHIISEKSGHGLANTEPELVVRAVREVVDQVSAAKQ